MKNLFLIISFFITLSCNSKNPLLDANIAPKENPIEERVYFSYKSGCNVILKLINNTKAVLTIGGKTKEGTIVKNPNSKDYFDIKQNGKIVVTFLYDEEGVIILNQQYQFECEQAKGIEMSLVNDDQLVFNEFKKYSDDREFIWDDIAAMNDKAYYLEQFKCYKASTFILDKVLEKEPERVVAWLNLGDSYWGQNKKEEAQKAYEKYVTLMKKQNKDLNKIPQRVNERTK